MDDQVTSRFWAGRSVLVTGATGLLGASILRLLASAGAQPVCLVRDWIPDAEAVRSGLLGRARVARGDVVDQALLERVMGEHEVDTVFHLAAQTIVSIANKNPVSTLESNIRGTWSLLEAARRSPRVAQVVVASSDKAYGAQPRLPYAEDMPLQGRHPYDVSKSCADLIAQMYAVTYGVPVCITRCGNLYGPGDLNWSRLVPGAFRSVLAGRRPVIRSDGTFVRDYLYVDDGAAAYLRAAEALGERPELRGQAFNFSNDAPIDVLEMVRRVAAAAGRPDLTAEVRGEATHEIKAQFLDSSKARRELGWRPRFTLDEGLALTRDWYRSFLAGS